MSFLGKNVHSQLWITNSEPTVGSLKIEIISVQRIKSTSTSVIVPAADVSEMISFHLKKVSGIKCDYLILEAPQITFCS